MTKIEFYIVVNGQLPAAKMIPRRMAHIPRIDEEVILLSILYRVTGVIYLESGNVQCYAVKVADNDD